MAETGRHDAAAELQRSRLIAGFLEAAVQAEGDDESTMLQALARQAAGLGGVGCVVVLMDPAGGSARVAAYHADDPERLTSMRRLLGRPLSRDEGGFGEVLRTGRPLLVPTREAEEAAIGYRTPGLKAYLEAHPTSGQAWVPIRVRGRIIAAIGLGRISEERPPLDESDLGFVESLAAGASLMFTNADARRALREGGLRSDLITDFFATVTQAPDEATVTRHLVATLGRAVRGAVVALRVAEDGVTLQPIAMATPDPAIEVAFRDAMTSGAWQLGSGLLGDVLRSGESAFLPSISAEALAQAMTAVSPTTRALAERTPPTSLMAMPLRTGDRVVGVVVAIRFADDVPFTEFERSFAETLAARTSIAFLIVHNRVELRRTTELVTALLDASPLAVMAVDADGRTIYWSRAAEDLYGWSRDDVLGREPPMTSPDDPDVGVSELERLRAGEVITAEQRRATRDGRVLDVRVHEAPLLDEEARFRGALGVHEDVTERNRLEADLVQAQKMETVGRLAGGVAHDFNNILTAIIGYAQLGRTATSVDEREEAFGTIQAAAERAAGLTQQLLAFSRRQMLQPAVVEANAVVDAVEPLLRRLIDESIDLRIVTSPDTGSVLADRTQLEQVVLNLAVNARDAMPGGGTLVIRTHRQHLGADRGHIELPPGEYVVVSVTDTGSGMDDVTKAHIFEPFFTTKPAGEGTGLGLATTYGIVRQSGGRIWVYSEPGRGTVFKIYLPRIGGPVTPIEPSVASVGRLTGRVLLVEDEALLRELSSTVVARAGFEVDAVPDPAAALAHVEAGGAYDVLVTDVVMPGMTGIELAQRLREREPGLRVVFMSGYSEDVVGHAAEPIGRRFLAKPFTPDALLRAIDGVLVDGD
jgi:PAS domain S-box-containing protein